ncbi:anon-1 [Drosophila grimshawi]|uniref:Anon-1 n=1 Tax=Drosophila grimshawi TaxID=7222 RepID=B4IZM3_DROGR|nr:anon-1 [Drosophila grimshawi]
MSASSEGGAVGGGAGGTATTTTPAHSTVAAKITHVKSDGGGISITGTPIISGGTIKVATAGNTVQAGSLSGTPISLNAGQSTTAASIRAIGTGGQSTQVRVMMPMIKQLENVTATGRTQITAIPATPTRNVSNASITVTRPVTQATYLPRASVTATQMSGVNVTGAQRLVTPLRATTTASVGVSPSPAGLSSTGNFVRTSQPSTVISSANSATAATAWMQSPTGQVQLIRAIHQPRQRIITTSAGVSSASVSSTATPVQAPTALTVSAAQPMPPQSSGATGVPQAYVATVLPPRQHQATLVYSSNMSAGGGPNTNPNAAQQFNPRFAVATPLGGTSGTVGSGTTTPLGTTVTPRQVRPIPLSKSFPATKLNTTSISIRAPSIPQLSSNVVPPTPVSVSGGVTVAGRGPTGGGVAPVALTAANLPTTRIIQLQQQTTGGAQQIIGSTARLGGNVMLQPFLMSTSAAAKIGIRPPVTKVQPSLTITQLNPIGKVSTTSGAGGATMTPQGVASIQAVHGVSATVTATSVTAGSSVAAAASVAGGATMQSLTIGGRGGPTSNILTGTLTPIKNASGITVGKMMMTQSSGIDSAGGATGLQSGGTPTNVFIQQRSGAGTGGVTVSTAATSVATSSTGAASFLPAGSSAIYYESMPASTGVLSLTTTTVTQSTHTLAQTQAQAQQVQAQAQLVSSSGGGSSLSVSSLPFASHAQQVQAAGGTGSTATFTVLPSSATAGGGVGSRTIGHQQLIIPAGAAPPQHMVIPLHTSVKVTTGGVPTTTGGGATVSALPMQVPVATNSLVASFMRKRDAEGSPIRGVKNLAPTLLSMSSNSNASAASVVNLAAAAASAFNLQPVSVAPVVQQPPTTTTVSSSALTVEALAKKDRERVSSSIAVAAVVGGASSVSTASASTTAGSIVGTRNVRAESPASSDGSTTVSANSSPGVDQQLQDSNLAINRIGDDPSCAAATHFNPISELIAAHQSQTLPTSVAHATLGSRGSAFVDVPPQQQAPHYVSLQTATLTASQLQQVRMNGTGGAGYDGLARKKPRRSTNDSQHSNQSQASLSLSLPPPSSLGSSSTQEATSSFMQQQQQQQQQHNQLPHQALNNGGLLLAAAGSATPNASAGDVNNHRPAVVGNKENANPVDFVLRRPRNCALLNTYKPTHKLANNHFHRYTDVKPRDERRATVIDLANQPNVQGKISGWKLYHLRSQMEDLNDSEMGSLVQLETMLKVLEKDKDNHSEIERVSELLKGNIQRSKIITDGINEAQNQLMKIFDHKPHVSDIINRLQSKRNFKKREKL